MKYHNQEYDKKLNEDEYFISIFPALEDTNFKLAFYNHFNFGYSEDLQIGFYDEVENEYKEMRLMEFD